MKSLVNQPRIEKKIMKILNLSIQKKRPII